MAELHRARAAGEGRSKYAERDDFCNEVVRYLEEKTAFQRVFTMFYSFEDQVLRSTVLVRLQFMCQAAAIPGAPRCQDARRRAMLLPK